MTRGVVFGLALALLLLPASSRADSFSVKAEGERWKPAHRYVTKGDRVIWRNPTKRVHDVSAYGGNWSKKAVLEPGERTSKRFLSRGKFKYRCVRHSAIADGKCDGMCGVVHVRKG